MDGYDNGGTLPHEVLVVDPATNARWTMRFIDKRYGPEQVLSPAQQARLRKAFREQS